MSWRQTAAYELGDILTKLACGEFEEKQTLLERLRASTQAIESESSEIRPIHRFFSREQGGDYSDEVDKRWESGR